MFTSADAIQKDNKDNAAISQDAQRRNAGLAGSANNPDGAATAECSFAMSEYSNTMSATAEQKCVATADSSGSAFGFCTSACVRRFPQYVLLYV